MPVSKSSPSTGLPSSSVIWVLIGVLCVFFPTAMVYQASSTSHLADSTTARVNSVAGLEGVDGDGQQLQVVQRHLLLQFEMAESLVEQQLVEDTMWDIGARQLLSLIHI